MNKPRDQRGDGTLPVPLPATQPASTLPFATAGSSPSDATPTVKDDAPSPPLNSALPPNVSAHFGDYEILGPLGRGGMGIVYKARHRKLQRLVALKMIVAGQLARREDVERFYTEARAAAALDHPGIVPVYEVGEHDGRHFYAMALVEGQSLAAELTTGPLSPEDAARMLAQISRAAHYAHERGVVHRDLKPGNVLLDAKDHPRLTDFGLAKIIASDSSLTMTGQIMGTPSYMAPEQAAGREIDARADVYALGSILYACLTGRPPFEAASAAETLRQVLDQEPVSPRQLNAAIPLDLDTICLKCLEKDPSRRYATAAELADELERFLAGKPIQARPVGRFERLRCWSRRHPREATLGALLISLLVLAAIGSTTAALLINDARADEVVARREESKARQEAIIARNRAQKDERLARDAERKATALLAESYAQTGRLAAQRGQWAVALENLNRALARGHADVIGVRLARVEAHSALNDVASARAEIESLALEENLGPHRGAVLLWQGDLALPRGEQEKAVRLIHEAQAVGLNEADAAYAKGLLADATPAAIEHFEAVLQHDPFHRRALTYLTLLLVLSGRHAQAGERLTTAELLFPDDVNFVVLRVASEAVQGRRDEAMALLDKNRDPLGGNYGPLKSIVDFLAASATAPDRWDAIDASLNDSRQMIATTASIQRLFLSGQGKEVSPVTISLTPHLKNSFGTLQQAVLTLVNPLVLRRDEKVASLLDQACRHHPEGTMYFMQANLYVGQEDWENAERAAVLAAQTPSIVPGFNREAYFVAAMAQAAQATKGNSEKLPLAVENVRQRVRLGNIRPLHAFYLRKIAAYGSDWPLARELSDMILRDRPDEAAPLAERAGMELKAGAYQSAIEFADRALAIQPELAAARDVRGQAVEKLQPLLASASPKATP